MQEEALRLAAGNKTILRLQSLKLLHIFQLFSLCNNPGIRCWIHGGYLIMAAVVVVTVAAAVAGGTVDIIANYF